MKTIKVSLFCGEPPFSLAKNEAMALLEALGENGLSSAEELTLDFADVDGVSASGARVLVYGLLRRLGEPMLERVIWVNLDPALRPTVEEAVNDGLEDLAKSTT